LTLESLLYHEIDCQWRKIFCPVLRCICNDTDGAKIIFNLFEDHLTEHHTNLVILNASFIESYAVKIKEDNLSGTTTGTWKPCILSLNGAQFFRQIALEKDRFYMWVYYYGSKEEAKNYSCAIKAYGSDNEEFINNGPPRSLDESKDEVIAGKS
jgi:hypothetical protein